MPYTKPSDAPAHVPAHLKAQWVEVFNSVWRKAKDEGKTDAEADALAFPQANGVAKRREHEPAPAHKVSALPDIHELFAPITKMYDGPDGFFLEGVLVAEEPDRTREIWDYASSKSSVIDWSEEAKRRTAGKSVGNLRSMHGNVATGRFLTVDPSDSQKLFNVRAEVVDEQDKEKCRKGVYSGFSIKAPYARRWPDPHNYKYTRWTSGPIIEGSLVDLPCIPGATFNIKVVTADRTGEWEETRRFANSDPDPWDLDLESLASRVAEKLEHNHSVNVSLVTQEETEMDYKAIAEKRGLNPDLFKSALQDALDEIAGKSAAKGMDHHDGDDCGDKGEMSEHGKAMKAKKNNPDASDVSGSMKDGAPAQPSTDGIKMADGSKMVCIGSTADGVKVYKQVAAEKSFVEIRTNSGPDISALLAEKMAPFEKAFDTLVDTVARLAALPRDSAVHIRESVDKSKDGAAEATKAAGGSGAAEKSASDLAKEGKPVDAIKMVHAAGPAFTLTNRGIQRPA